MTDHKYICSCGYAGRDPDGDLICCPLCGIGSESNPHIVMCEQDGHPRLPYCEWCKCDGCGQFNRSMATFDFYGQIGEKLKCEVCKRPGKEEGMNNWEQRIDHAIEAVKNDSLGKADRQLTGEGVRAMLLFMLGALKRSGKSTDDTLCCNCQEAPAYAKAQCRNGCGVLCFRCGYTDGRGNDLCPKCYEVFKESLIYHPDGRIWFCHNNGKHKFCVMKNSQHNVSECSRYLTKPEALRAGAFVELKFESGEMIRGHIMARIGANEIVNEKVVISCGAMLINSDRGLPIQHLTLIKCAPGEDE